MTSALTVVACMFVGIYLIVSFMSAIRMGLVHGHYVHIEFSRRRWARWGRWAPQRLRLLTRLQLLAGLAVLSWIAGEVVSILAG